MEEVSDWVLNMIKQGFSQVCLQNPPIWGCGNPDADSPRVLVFMSGSERCIFSYPVSPSSHRFSFSSLLTSLPSCHLDCHEHPAHSCRCGTWDRRGCTSCTTSMIDLWPSRGMSYVCIGLFSSANQSVWGSQSTWMRFLTLPRFGPGCHWSARWKFSDLGNHSKPGAFVPSRHFKGCCAWWQQPPQSFH